MDGRGREGKAAASYINIPDDLCGEILYRLPSNDILNCKLVCKDWLRSISSKGFRQKHLQRSKADGNNLKIVLQSASTAKIIDCAENTSKKMLYTGRDQRQVLGCCDGLVLYYDNCHRQIAAMNPCTGESLLLVPLPDQDCIKLREFRWMFSWFGHHPSTGQYVLVVAYYVFQGIELKVYSLSLDRNNTNLLLLSSSTLHQPGVVKYDLCHYSRICTSLHGRLHCPVLVSYINELRVRSVILVYDFETNKITKMTPPAIKDRSMVLGVVDGCLCAIERKQVWTMKKYGVKKSWTKKYANLDGVPLAFCPDGGVIIGGDHWLRKVSKYSLIKRQREATILCRTTVKIVRKLVALGCIDSMVSPTLLWREDE